MNSKQRSFFSASLFGAGLAAVLAVAACKSASGTGPDGPIIVEGDDGCMIHAMGLEEALQKSIEARKAALARGDKAGAADWMSIIEKILDAKKKKSDEQQKALAEAVANGDVTQSVDAEGNTFYFAGDAGGGGAAGGSN